MTETLYKGLVGNAKSIMNQLPKKSWLHVYALWLANETKPFNKEDCKEAQKKADELSHWVRCQHHSGGSHMVLLQYTLDYLGARTLSEVELAYMQENKELK
jgi:acyl-CoA thioesterase